MIIKKGLCTETWYSPKRYSTKSIGEKHFYARPNNSNNFIKYRKDGPSVITEHGQYWIQGLMYHNTKGPSAVMGYTLHYYKNKYCGEEIYWNS